MKVLIVHDSQHGNGIKLAETIAQTFGQENALIKRHSDISPEEVAQESPDLIILGAAVRVFHLNRGPGKWWKNVVEKLSQENKTIPFGACFVTHAMSKEKVEKKAQKFCKNAGKGSVITHLYPDWLSGQVEDIEGPFKPFVLDDARKFSADLLAWITEKKESPA